MIDLQAVERCLALLLQDHYMQNSAVRHSPLFQDVDRLHREVREAIDQQNDDADQEAFEKWRGSKR